MYFDKIYFHPTPLPLLSSPTNGFLSQDCVHFLKPREYTSAPCLSLGVRLLYKVASKPYQEDSDSQVLCFVYREPLFPRALSVNIPNMQM